MDPNLGLVAIAVVAVVVIGAVWTGFYLRGPEVERLESELEASIAARKQERAERLKAAAGAADDLRAEREAGERLGRAGDDDDALFDSVLRDEERRAGASAAAQQPGDTANA